MVAGRPMWNTDGPRRCMWQVAILDTNAYARIAHADLAVAAGQAMGMGEVPAVPADKLVRFDMGAGSSMACPQCWRARMAWMRVTDREAAYAERVLDTEFRDQNSAMIDRNVIALVGKNGDQRPPAAVPRGVIRPLPRCADSGERVCSAGWEASERLHPSAAEPPGSCAAFFVFNHDFWYDESCNGLVAQLVRAPA